jgi:hypothetical protein
MPTPRQQTSPTTMPTISRIFHLHKFRRIDQQGTIRQPTPIKSKGRRNRFRPSLQSLFRHFPNPLRFLQSIPIKKVSQSHRPRHFPPLIDPRNPIVRRLGPPHIRRRHTAAHAQPARSERQRKGALPQHCSSRLGVFAATP